MKYLTLLLLTSVIFLASCNKGQIVDNNNPSDTSNIDGAKKLTIFFINDQHGQINNFAKIKYIIDQERAKTRVIVTCSGDMFSGNPVVDDYTEKGFPMIDLMNKVGFDIAIFGNHEFDYGEDALKDREEQANFDWVCANVNTQNSDIRQPYDYKTITKDSLKITFLGLIETNGKQNGTIPLTHPWKIKNLIFVRPETVVSKYSNTKNTEDADLFIALTHLGYSSNSNLGDVQLAKQFPYFDLIIGGHSHQKINTKQGDSYIVQAGSHLSYLGKVQLSIKDKKIVKYNYNLINLNNYSKYDTDLKAIIDDYNNSMASVLDEVIGNSETNHSRSKLGCFYTDALRGRLNVDVSFQNGGGIRSDLDKGNITKREIYEIDPFNNGSLIFSMTVAEIKAFLRGINFEISYSGIEIKRIGNDIEIRNLAGNIISDNTILTVGINDYIPAVNDNLFPTTYEEKPYTTAEALIYYLKNINNTVNYPNCERHFQY